MTIQSTAALKPSLDDEPQSSPPPHPANHNAFARPLAFALIASRGNDTACTPVHNRGASFLPS